MKKEISPAFACAMALLCGFPALTAVAAPAVPLKEVPDSVISLKEVSVTAIKEQNAISRAPMAVTKIGLPEIENQQIASVKNVSALVPNLFIPDYGSRMTSSIYIRGIGARMDQPAVGLNVDNVPYLNKDNFDIDIPDIERIEVFRGPQTTLYGRNTMGGLISVYTLSPYNFQGLKVSGEAGTKGRARANVGYYRKFSDKLASSLTVGYSHYDGFFRNALTGRKVDKDNSMSARFRVDHHPRTNLTISNALSVAYTSQGGYPYEDVETGLIAYNDECSYKRLGITDGLTVTMNLSGMTLSSITSYQYLSDDMKLDQDFRPVDYFTLNQVRHEYTFTQDFIARGSKGRYTWLGGLFGFYKRGNMNAPVTFKDQGIKELIEDKANNPQSPMQIKWDSRTMMLESRFRTPTAGAAVYHRSALRLGHWNLSADLRLDYEHASLDYHSYVNTALTLYNMRGPQPIPLRNIKVEIDESDRLNKSFLELMPKFTAEYNLKNASVYASVAKGYKSGGFNTQMFSDILQQKLMSQMGTTATYDVDEIVSYRPEKSWNFELGSNFSVPSARLTGSTALFFIHCINQQLTVFPEGNTTGRMMANAGRTRSMGAELSLTYNPVKNLNLSASYGFTDAKFRKFDNGKQDYRGNKVPYAPGNTLFVSADYAIPVYADKLFLETGVSVTGAGRIYWDEGNTLSQPFYALMDAYVGLKYDNLTFRVRGQNLTGTKYNVFYFESVNHSFLQRGLPARCSVSFSYDF